MCFAVIVIQIGCLVSTRFWLCYSCSTVWVFYLAGLLMGLQQLLLQVRITFDEPEPGVTVVKLIHSDVPEEDRLVSIYIATT
jgi:hypothetical protein